MIRSPATDGLLQPTLGPAANPLTAPVNAMVALAGGKLAEGAGSIEAAAEVPIGLLGGAARLCVGAGVPEQPDAASATTAAATIELT